MCCWYAPGIVIPSLANYFLRVFRSPASNIPLIFAIPSYRYLGHMQWLHRAWHNGLAFRINSETGIGGIHSSENFFVLLQNWLCWQVDVVIKVMVYYNCRVAGTSMYYEFLLIYPWPKSHSVCSRTDEHHIRHQRPAHDFKSTVAYKNLPQGYPTLI